MGNGEVPNAETNPPGAKTPAQVAQEVRHGPAAFAVAEAEVARVARKAAADKDASEATIIAKKGSSGGCPIC